MQKERHGGVTKNNKHQVKMEKYIKKEDLGEVIAVIAASAAENADDIRTEINIAKGWRERLEVKVTVRSRHSFNTLAEDEYVILEGVKPTEYCDTIINALDAQKADTSAKEE